MYWNKIKSMLILLFAAVDIFFLFNLYRQYMNQNYIDERVLTNTATLLADAGISVADDAIPDRLFEENVVECLYGEDYYEKIFQNLGGGDDYSSFIKTGALGQGMKFTSDANNITAEFYSGFYLRYVYGDVQTRESELSDYLTALSGINPDGMDSMDEKILSKLESVGNRQLRALSRILGKLKLAEGDSDIEVKFVIEACAYDAVHNRYLINCREYVENIAVCDSSALAIVEDGELIWLSGKVLFFEISGSYTTDLYDQVNILFDEKAYVEEHADEITVPCEILKMDIVYCVSWYSGGDLYYLIPAWRVAYSDGSVRIRSAMNGSLYDI